MTRKFSQYRDRITQHRFAPVAILVLLIFILSFVTRIVLLIGAGREAGLSPANLAGIFLIGLFYDLAMATYFSIPLIFYCWLVPDKIYRKRWQRFFLYGLFFILTFILVFTIPSEWFFWQEFSSRFNFIAVNYLVYTNEVMGNIRESYPLNSIIAGVVLTSIFIVLISRKILKRSMLHSMRLGRRSLWALILLAFPILAFFTVNNSWREFSNNRYANELAGNGIYELFSAFRNNELDYTQFYTRIPDQEAFKNLRSLLQTPDSHFTSTDPENITRHITNPGPEKRLNVILISVESLSAKFLGVFGDTLGMTPNMDTLARHSLLFTRLYATGTRTVRGLESLSMSVPPTPGRSIVKRPHNEGVFTLGDVFNSKGYESKFLYGGYGYFDNMNYFFANNGYKVVDRRALDKKDIDYENIWGVADENLFTLAIREMDKTIATGKPVFEHIMTTSNHRPYTYPEGRIDIPSHTSRIGAVKYTDYAIGKFIHESAQKPWFNNTIFVITADHCAHSAGKTDLPVSKYHIPMLIYSPQNIQPGEVTRLMSQIDIPPTLLGLLNFSYDSKFYGYDIFKIPKEQERIFFGTYQNLGYLRDSTLIILSPQQKVATYRPDFKTGNNTLLPHNDTLEKQAVTYYQTASFLFDHRLDKDQ